MKRWIFSIAAAICTIFPTAASATFSIVACDQGGACGAAVATNNLAVGASVIYARARIGALATQFETNPNYGREALALLADGANANDVLKSLLANDGNFDGQDISYRQVGIVAATGDGVAYTGSRAREAQWAGSLAGPGYSVQGNGLAGPDVAAAMQRAFLTSKGSLAERLMTALEAGQAAGGQSTGKLSAALLVRTPDGAWQDVDLRVDAAAEPVSELRRLLGMRLANDALIMAERAFRSGNRQKANDNLAEATRLGAGWDRVWRRAARLSISMGEANQAMRALGALYNINPRWAKLEAEDPIYEPLRGNALFETWRRQPN